MRKYLLEEKRNLISTESTEWIINTFIKYFVINLFFMLHNVPGSLSSLSLTIFYYQFYWSHLSLQWKPTTFSHNKYIKIMAFYF